MTYTPRWSDPRIQQRIRRAIGFAAGVMSPESSQAWSTRYIDQWFGQQQNPLSRYLRQQLLIETNSRWNKDTGECKQYRLNSSGVRFLSDAIGVVADDNTQLYPIVLQVAQSQYQTELTSGTFEYNDQSSRLWHPLQSFRREIKQSVLEQNGYLYHYDIQACAMTLIHQHSQRVPEVIVDGVWQSGPMDLYLFALRDYLRDRNTVRQQIATDTDIDPVIVKRMINALLAGARLSAHPETEIYQMLNGDLARIQFLQQHQYLTDLRADIKTCWDYIRPTIPPRFSNNTKSGRPRRLPMSSRQKWMLYFDLERQVLNEIRTYLSERGHRYFLEHDGWSCDHLVDQQELAQFIHERTGFDVEFELKK